MLGWRTLVFQTSASPLLCFLGLCDAPGATPRVLLERGSALNLTGLHQRRPIWRAQSEGGRDE